MSRIYDVLKIQRDKNPKVRKLCCRILTCYFMNSESLPKSIYLRDAGNVSEEEVIQLFKTIGYIATDVNCYFKKDYFCVTAEIRKSPRKTL